MKITDRLIIYRNFAETDLLNRMVWVAENYQNEDQEKLLENYLSCIHELVELASVYGFEGNLWHMYLTHLLVNDENVYSTLSEIRGALDGSVSDLAMHDFVLIRELYHISFTDINEKLGESCLSGVMEDYRIVSGKKYRIDARIRKHITALNTVLEQSADAESFMREITAFYQHLGCGKIGLHKAFRIRRENEELKIEPVPGSSNVHLDDLVGYEVAKKKLIDNTEAFVSGRNANNCLLYGDAGTGKSTSIKAISNMYYERGLRIIEVYKHQFQDLHDLIARLKNRNYKFIIYMDDLSFEDFEIEYKYLKAVIEGGLEKKPDNVLIYATSNRRHLIREKFSDKAERDDDLHTNDTVQEKMSLANRFGVQIYFERPEKKEFQHIVKVLAEKNHINLSEEELFLEVNKWELSHSGYSGRTAQQWVDHWLGQQK